MPASESEWKRHAVGGNIQIAAGTFDTTVFGQDKCPVELGQLLDSPAQFRPVDRSDVRMMGRKRIED